MYGLGDVRVRNNWPVTDWTCYYYPSEMQPENVWMTWEFPLSQDLFEVNTSYQNGGK